MRIRQSTETKIIDTYRLVEADGSPVNNVSYLSMELAALSLAEVRAARALHERHKAIFALAEVDPKVAGLELGWTELPQQIAWTRIHAGQADERIIISHTGEMGDTCVVEVYGKIQSTELGTVEFVGLGPMEIYASSGSE